MTGPLRLSVLGTDYRISLGDPALRDHLTALFGRFLIEPADSGSSGGGAPRRIEVRSGENPAVVLDGHARSLSPDAALPQAFITLNEIFLRESRGCRVLHAAALTHEGRATLVSGPSTYGKSTLALLLLERGLGFLGDDFAPLDLETGKVLPFPKTIGLRPRAEELLSPSTRSRLAGVPERRLAGKRLVDVDELFPGQLDGPAPVDLVVLLDPPSGTPRGSRPLLEIGTLGEVTDLPGVLSPFGQVRGPSRDGAISTYVLEREGGTEGGVRDLAHALDPLADRILYVEKLPGVRPRFDGDPVLEPCPPSEGLLALGADLLDRTGPRGRLLDEEESAVDLLFELGRHLAQARFMRLKIGRFDAMADWIARAARAAGEDTGNRAG